MFGKREEIKHLESKKQKLVKEIEELEKEKAELTETIRKMYNEIGDLEIIKNKLENTCHKLREECLKNKILRLGMDVFICVISEDDIEGKNDKLYHILISRVISDKHSNPIKAKSIILPLLGSEIKKLINFLSDIVKQELKSNT